MPSPADIAVTIIPPELHAASWPIALPFLRKASETCEESEAELARRLAEKEAQLWLVVDLARLSTEAAFLTSVHDGGKGRFLWLFGLGGREPRAWALAVQTAVTTFAKHERCGAVRFSGSKAWKRLLRGVSVIAAHVRGEPIYEWGVKS